MIALGFGITWVGYGLLLSGWAKVKGYGGVTLGDLFRPTGVYPAGWGKVTPAGQPAPATPSTAATPAPSGGTPPAPGIQLA